MAEEPVKPKAAKPKKAAVIVDLAEVHQRRLRQQRQDAAAAAAVSKPTVRAG